MFLATNLRHVIDGDIVVIS